MIAYYSSENQILIVPGARGVENAKYLATYAWAGTRFLSFSNSDRSCPNILAVYLSVNNELSNQRMQERMKGETQGQSQDLISDWEYEENLYQTSKIEGISIL